MLYCRYGNRYIYYSDTEILELGEWLIREIEKPEWVQAERCNTAGFKQKKARF